MGDITVIRSRGQPVMTPGLERGPLWSSQNHTGSACHEKEINLHDEGLASRGNGRPQREDVFNEAWKKLV